MLFLQFSKHFFLDEQVYVLETSLLKKDPVIVNSLLAFPHPLLHHISVENPLIFFHRIGRFELSKEIVKESDEFAGLDVFLIFSMQFFLLFQELVDLLVTFQELSEIHFKNSLSREEPYCAKELSKNYCK